MFLGVRDDENFQFFQFSSVQFIHSVVSDSLQPHESQHARPPCPSPTSRVHSDSCSSISIFSFCVLLLNVEIWPVWNGLGQERLTRTGWNQFLFQFEMNSLVWEAHSLSAGGCKQV